MKWAVIDEEWNPDEDSFSSENIIKLGLKEFKARDHPKEQALASLFLDLTFADWRVFLGELN
jgi:hypothetical protein